MDDMRTPLPAGRFRSLTGLSDKALRLYAERGLLVPAAVDADTGYRTYDRDQLRDGVVLDLLRRAHVPLGELAGADRFDFDEHRMRLVFRRAMEDFSIDLAERVAQGDPSSLVASVVDAPETAWIGVDVPFDVPSPADEAAGAFSALAVDLPELDRALLAALGSAGVELLPESWTTSAGGDADPRMRLAHRLPAAVDEDTRRRVAEIVRGASGSRVRVTTGALPVRREVVFSAPDGAPVDETGLEDTALSHLAAIAFALHLDAHGGEALGGTARRRVDSASVFAPSASAEDVYDVIGSARR